MQWWSRVIKEVTAAREECPVPVRELASWNGGQTVEAAAEKGEDGAGALAGAILEQARREAEALRRAAQEEVELWKRRAWEEGYNRGLEEGRRAGWEAGAAEARALREEAENYRLESKQLLEEVGKAYRETIAAAQDRLLELALEIAAKIVGRQVELHPETVLDIVRRAVLQVAEGQFYTIYAAPKDAEFLRQHREEILKELAAEVRLQVVADAGLKPGGCRVETENGFVDATVDTQLEEIRRLLKAGGPG